MYHGELNHFYQMKAPQRSPFLAKFNNTPIKEEANHSSCLSITPENSGLLYPPYSILAEIFDEASDLLPTGIASGAPVGVKVIQNMQDFSKPITVTFNLQNGIVKCQSCCDRFKAYNICEHTLSVSEKEGILHKFLDDDSPLVSRREIYLTLAM